MPVHSDNKLSQIMRSRVKTTKESLKANREQLNDLADTVRTITEFDTVHRYEMQEKVEISNLL